MQHPEQGVVVHRRAPYGPPSRGVGRLTPSTVAGWEPVAVIDVAGFVADLKDHAVDHGFHVHDERHFVETYSLRQAWEVDLHPEEACGGPLDLHLSLEVDPRSCSSFEDLVARRSPRTRTRPTASTSRSLFTWALPPLPDGPDLLVLATELAASAAPTSRSRCRPSTPTASVTDAAERSLTIVAHIEVSLARDVRRPGAAVRHARPVRRRSATTCSTGPRRGSAKTSDARSPDPRSCARSCCASPRAGELPILLGAVRDEFVERPWDPPARHWDGAWAELIGGRDQQAGGTWLAVDPRAAGRWRRS